ncbi:4393_t:CDS:2 [Paraglomus occultum]|uniref:4393_t:CDS:1 n=1 Tax=Paraglomus occultum TaxID=144539 RepID=A0A9N8VLZ9_9GLOM|nr:4393_t:CDS:2 [Paraglomus occultum]
MALENFGEPGIEENVVNDDDDVWMVLIRIDFTIKMSILRYATKYAWHGPFS